MTTEYYQSKTGNDDPQCNGIPPVVEVQTDGKGVMMKLQPFGFSEFIGITCPNDLCEKDFDILEINFKFLGSPIEFLTDVCPFCGKDVSQVAQNYAEAYMADFYASDNHPF